LESLIHVLCISHKGHHQEASSSSSHTKSGKIIANYLLDINKTVDSLSSIGASISTVEHIDAILDGLSEEYDGFITAVLSRCDPYTADELESSLLAQEERFEKHKLMQTPSS